MRGTTRDTSRRDEIETVGAEAVIADPDRIGTLTPAFDHVSIACVLLGSAKGSAESLAALHGPRLATLLHRMVDTTVRGIVYEASGPAGSELLDAGAEHVRLVCEDSRIPYQLLRAERDDHEAWLRDAIAAVESVLGQR